MRLFRASGLTAIVCALLSGCHAWQPATYQPPDMSLSPPPMAASNPVLVAALDRDFVWEQVVDVVDDYFKIEKEIRPKLVGDLLTEGMLETYPRGSSTMFEPWGKDTVTRYDRWEATLQSMRRLCRVRVSPTETGYYAVEVQVLKQLEDVPRPESGAISMANAQALRNDNSLQRVTNPIGGQEPTIGWIDKGRDPTLEQVMLAQIQARLGSAGGVQVGPPPVQVLPSPGPEVIQAVPIQPEPIPVPVH